MYLKDPVAKIRGVGSKTATLYNRLGIENIEDLIYHFPRRYEDYSQIVAIKDIKPGPVTIKVKVKSVTSRYARRGLHITEGLISDDSGSIKVIWFNQPYRAEALKTNHYYYVSGIYEFQKNRYSITNPSAELVSSFPKNTARIVPIYPETKGLKSHQIRKHIAELLPLIKELVETLPPNVLKQEKLLGRAEALRQLHFPSSNENLILAKDRLGFEELFEVSLAGLLNKRAIAEQRGDPIAIDEMLAKKFVSSLPFKLTDAQRRAAWQVLNDLTNNQPMNRLVEGDVGSGKTIVAALAILMAAKVKKQVAYMAPTEILARQQYEVLGRMLQNFKVKTELYISALSKEAKNSAASSIKTGKVDLIVGTHALIQKHPVFKSLSLVIIDEQHRFGVNQREKLLGKAKNTPHVLTMTATPIPRSLALTLYGELDVSIIDELPPGRKPVITELISFGARSSVYEKVDAMIESGRQCFVICPLVEDSDTLGVKSVTKEYKRLSETIFKHRKIGLIHGRLKTEQKEQVMKQFSDGEIDILVATTVVEVGVNVPNATVMIVEGAERFGLSQLHQLRGRIRRSAHQAHCYLIVSSSSQPPRRLRAMTTTNDGFKLAQLDLELRGPGEIYGVRQHGVLDLRMARLTDLKMIARARHAAKSTLDNDIDLLQYPRLKSRVENLRKITSLN